MDYYNALLAERDASTVAQITTAEGRTQTVSGTGEATVTRITLENEDGEPVELSNVGSAVSLHITVKALASIPRLVLGYMIKDRLGQAMYGTNTHHMQCALENIAAGDIIDYRFRFPLNLGPGSYSVTTALTSDETHLGNNYEWRDLALLFMVVNMNRREFVGSSWIEPQVEISR